MKTTIIVAMTADGGIGLDGEIPWVSRKDMRFFYAETTRLAADCAAGAQNAVIMGRATWESLPRALRGRVNVVLSARWAGMSADDIRRETGGPPPDIVAESFSAAMDALEARSNIGAVFVIGGERVFADALRATGDRACGELIVTHILPLVPCDRRFPIALAVEAGFTGLAEQPIGGEPATVCDSPLPFYAPQCVIRRYVTDASPAYL